MSLVFLSWAYPPMRYPRAVQVERLARHIKTRPVRIYCLAPEGGVVSNESASEISITRIPPTRIARLLKPYLPAAASEALLSKDAAWMWWRCAAACIARDCAPGDVLVTFGQPMADHLAGLRLKRAHGLKWIAHFSDPWADNPFLSGAAARARRLEAQVLEEADMAVFTSIETADLVMAKYPQSWRQKTAVLPHAFDPALYPDARPQDGAFTVRHLGNFYGERGPEPLFRALPLLARLRPEIFGRLRIELIGAASAKWRQKPDEFPPDTVRVLPPVEYGASLALMRSADLLLVIDAPFERSVFLPSKLVDYIGADRPILGITPPGTAARIIRDLGGWVANPDDPEGIAEALAAALTATGRGAAWGNPEIRRKFAAASVAAEFDALLERAAGGTRT